VLYAKVVLGLPVEGPFDYSVGEHLHKKIRAGVRAWIQFRAQRKLGYVVKLAAESNIERVKPILEIIDDFPIIDKNMLLVTRELSDYYGCSWGEAIETALPQGLRKGKEITNNIKERKDLKHKDKRDVVLIHDLDGRARWDIYLKLIKETLDNNKSAVVLLPDIASVLKVKEIINANLGISPSLLYRKQPGELDEWLKIKERGCGVVVGTRSAIFAPVNNLGLVIIDEEQDTVYKQDQVPHYHAREVAFMRTAIEKAKLILGSASPSLESFYLAKKGKINYTLLPRKRNFPQIKIIDMRQEQRYSRQKNIIFSKYLLDCIMQGIDEKGKTLLFLNKSGFATFASCRNCGTVLKCPRCNVNLVYHFKDNILTCRYCNFKIPPPRICPDCNSAYIRYLGTGREKIESELSRVFPHARIRILDNLQDAALKDGDIFISSASIIKKTNYPECSDFLSDSFPNEVMQRSKTSGSRSDTEVKAATFGTGSRRYTAQSSSIRDTFDLIGVLSIDDSLNRIDLRSTEKVFGLLSGLLTLTQEKIVIQTQAPRHYCFGAIENKDINLFYEEELKQRKQLQFPPYRHLCLLKLRGKKENSVKEASSVLFDRLSKYGQSNKSIKVVSVNPGEPGKLRGNFYWQILIKAGSASKIVKFIKLHLKNFSHSGIIVTIDVDPV